MPEIKQDIRAATIIVAAYDSVHKNMADYVCDGINDHIEIQAAIDALPATGGEVKLLDGTYNCEVQINLDSNQTLRGCGRNTILTTTTANLVFLRAVGGSGTEKTGIVIADLQIDGATVSDCGIYFYYVDYSFIRNVYSRRHFSGTGSYKRGIYLFQSDFNQIADNICQGNETGIRIAEVSCNNIVSENTCQGNNGDGILFVDSSEGNTISGNTCQGNGCAGIAFDYLANYNTISSNTCQGNDFGIHLGTASYNTITGNTCQRNRRNGIWLDDSSNSNTISGNACVVNSQTADNTYDNILLAASDYNLITGNVCRQGALTNKPRYGINISNDACDRNCLIGNDLYDSGKTGDLNDVPTTNPTLKQANRNLAGTGWLLADDNEVVLKVSVAHDNQNPAVATIPAGSFVTAEVWVNELFNSDGTDTIAVGYDADPDSIVDETDVSSVGRKAIVYGVEGGYMGTARAIEVYYVAGGSAPTTGHAVVVLRITRSPTP